MVDEAHAVGTAGPGGRGVVAALGLTNEVDLMVGTLGKSLGAYGAYAACDTQMARFLINSSRSFIYSTAPSPPIVAAAAEALELLIEQPRRVLRLQQNSELFRRELQRHGFNVSEVGSHIVPLLTGDAESAMAMSEQALERGVFAQAIRPPTVPDGMCRLRISVMAAHKPDELRTAARILAGAAKAVGFDASTGMPGEFDIPGAEPTYAPAADESTRAGTPQASSQSPYDDDADQLASVA
jgi:glycine C-acetyltransferase/8-amino-7-oxononanoate synthase